MACENLRQAIDKYTPDQKAPWNRAIKADDQEGLKKAKEEAQKIRWLITTCQDCPIANYTIINRKDFNGATIKRRA